MGLKAVRKMPGLFIRGGSYVAVARDRNGKQVWHSLGKTAHLTRAEACEKARDVIKAVKEGKDRSGPQTFDRVAAAFMTHHVAAQALITEKYIRATLDKHILPAWGARDFVSINRADVAGLLDGIVETAGPVAADKTLAILSKLMRWHSARNSDYVSPIVSGMRRSNPKLRARTRILNDDEIRTLWKAAESNGTFGAFVRVALLTGQRRQKVLTMKWEDIRDRVWLIPTEEREKGTAGQLRLPQAALDIIEAQPRFVSSPYVFSNGRGYIQGISRYKSRFDAIVNIPAWTLHDLRRTARSLLSRAGVRPDISERVLGHVIGGVEGIYDRHDYAEEKARALAALASLIENIVHPSPNVVPLRA